tara:strand:- start:1963 stop:2403 length:441 start_codon:yes stop_codon:yes gene_type:complete
MEIRRASPFDITAILGMLLEMHQGTELETPKINSEKMVTKVNEVIHRGVVFVALDEKNNLIGSVGGMVGQDWWSEEKFLADNWFYVSPDHRKTPAALNLIKNFIKSANDAKLPVRLGHIFSGDLERKDKFFEKLGMTKAGSVFVEA